MVNITILGTRDNKTNVSEIPFCLCDFHNEKPVQMCAQRWLLFGCFKDSDDAHMGTFGSISVKRALDKISQNKSVSSGLNVDKAQLPGSKVAEFI